MRYEEIALQLTLKAMDKNVIAFKDQGTYDDRNTFNPQQIADFYNKIYNAISTDEFIAQSIDA